MPSPYCCCATKLLATRHDTDGPAECARLIEVCGGLRRQSLAELLTGPHVWPWLEAKHYPDTNQATTLASDLTMHECWDEPSSETANDLARGRGLKCDPGTDQAVIAEESLEIVPE